MRLIHAVVGKNRAMMERLHTYDLFADDMKPPCWIIYILMVRVLGRSDGGNTGLIMAMKYPAKVKRMVTMGANVFIDNTVVDAIGF